jgi:prenyltransferase beta subunit
MTCSHANLADIRKTADAKNTGQYVVTCQTYEGFCLNCNQYKHGTKSKTELPSPAAVAAAVLAG